MMTRIGEVEAGYLHHRAQLGLVDDPFHAYAFEDAEAAEEEARGVEEWSAANGGKVAATVETVGGKVVLWVQRGHLVTGEGRRTTGDVGAGYVHRDQPRLDTMLAPDGAGGLRENRV